MTLIVKKKPQVNIGYDFFFFSVTILPMYIFNKEKHVEFHEYIKGLQIAVISLNYLINSTV